MLAVIDPRMPTKAKERLKQICETVELPPFSALDERVASHPDMLIFQTDGKLFTCKDYYAEAKSAIDKIISCAGFELVLTDDALSSEYPNDIKFNLLSFSGGFIGNLPYISTEIKEYLKSKDIPYASVKQGYSKCSSVVLDNAVISADKGICEAVLSLGGSALKISSGGVLLQGYGEGFLGGASGVYEKTVFFCGDAKKHQDYDKIYDFCSVCGYEIISLSNEPLYDVGTIFFF